MKRYRLIVVTVALTTLYISSPSFALCARSTFDTGFDGWTPEGSGDFFYMQDGGNPGGFVKFVDVPDDQHPRSGDGWLLAPGKFLGDWSSLDSRGVLSWDHIILETGGGPIILQGQVMISGPSGSARCTTLESMGEAWQSFSIPLKESAWVLISGSWIGLISNVTELKIRIEGVWNSAWPLDTDGIDNIILSGARTLKGDLNNDGIVDFKDFAILASEWLQTESWYSSKR